MQPVSPAGPNSASGLSSYPSLVWSTRESIRAQLLSLLHTAPRRESWLRWRILRLLRIFGSPELIPLLHGISFDRSELVSIRDEALAVAQWYGMHLSAAELTDLLAQGAAPDGGDGPPVETWFLKPRKLLSMVRGDDDEACAAAEAALERRSPEARVSILSERDAPTLPPRLVEWLFARWYSEDRHHLTGMEAWGHDDNFRVALEHRERPEAWKLLVEWARNRTTGDLEPALYRELPNDEWERLLDSAPGLRDAAAGQLLLAPNALAAWHGREALLRRLERTVRAHNVACRVPGWFRGCPPELPRTAKLLVAWPEARPLLYRFLCDFDLADEVRHELLTALFRQDRATTIRWAVVAARYPDNLPLVYDVVRWAAYSPEPGDRELFLSALRGTDEVAQGFALEGLFLLGESGTGWCDRLTTLTRSDHPLVRLRATACLAKEGRSEWCTLLRAMVFDAPEPWLRADAARWLRELNTEKNRPVLHQALAAYLQLPPPRRGREIFDVVLALSRLGAREDLSALLQASFDRACTFLIDHELERHLMREEGNPFVELPLPRLRCDASVELLDALRVAPGT